MIFFLCHTIKCLLNWEFESESSDCYTESSSKSSIEKFTSKTWRFSKHSQKKSKIWSEFIIMHFYNKESSFECLYKSQPLFSTKNLNNHLYQNSFTFLFLDCYTYWRMFSIHAFLFSWIINFCVLEYFIVIYWRMLSIWAFLFS